MSRNYDHHWTKGREKPGIPMEIPSEAEKRRAQMRKKATKKRKRLATAVPPAPGRVPMPLVPGVQPPWEGPDAFGSP